MKPLCKNCHFHEAAGEGKDGDGNLVKVGVCFRYPPQFTPERSSFPTVGSDKTWCGEFRQAEKPAAKAKPKGTRK